MSILLSSLEQRRNFIQTESSDLEKIFLLCVSLTLYSKAERSDTEGGTTECSQWQHIITGKKSAVIVTMGFNGMTAVIVTNQKIIFIC